MSARPVGQQQLAGQTVVVLGASSFDLKMPEPVHGQVVEWWMASPWLR
jgi:hypothetical protein